MNHQLDVSVQDAELLAEIELMGVLMIAASECEGDLSPERIDELLGVVAPVPKPRRG